MPPPLIIPPFSQIPTVTSAKPGPGTVSLFYTSDSPLSSDTPRFSPLFDISPSIGKSTVSSLTPLSEKASLTSPLFQSLSPQIEKDKDKKNRKREKNSDIFDRRIDVEAKDENIRHTDIEGSAMEFDNMDDNLSNTRIQPDMRIPNVRIQPDTRIQSDLPILPDIPIPDIRFLDTRIQLDRSYSRIQSMSQILSAIPSPSM